MSIRFLFILSFLVLGCFPVNAQEMSIDEAYRMIPHKQTPFDPKQSRIKAADSKYLDHYFFVSDMAMRARVMTLRYFYGQNFGMDLERYNKEINDLVASFALIPTPRHLQAVEKTLISAIKDQQMFFNEWEKVRGTPKFENLKKNYRNNRQVQSSHKKLLQAYGMLKKIYPRESSHNQTAFFDHLCALDFI